jgi:D-alanine-D-alanine ligase
MDDRKTSVVVLYNQTGKDIYEEIRKVDPASLGFTPEYNIHVATAAEEYKAIVTELRKERFRVRAVNLKEDLGKLHRLLNVRPPDVIFNLVEYFHDDPALEDAVVAMYELHRVAYTGAPAFALGLCRRKGLTKQVLLRSGVATPRFRLIFSRKVTSRHGLRYPLIVKPARHDASLGVNEKSVVHDHPELMRQVDRLLEEYDPPILIEEFLEGEELHVSILGNDPPKVLPIVQFDFTRLPKDYPPAVTHDVKWNPLSIAYHRVDSHCPARLPAPVEKCVRQQALQAYLVTECRDYARIDIRLDRRGKPHVLEVNPNPDLTEGVSFMESAERAGLSFSAALRKIVELALRRVKGV